MATLSQIIDQYKNDPKYWKLSLESPEGASVLKRLNTWSDDPMIKGFMSLNAQRGYDGVWDEQIFVEIPNGGTRSLLTQDWAVPDSPSTPLSQILDQNKNDPRSWQLALPFSEGLAQAGTLGALAENPLIQALMPLNAEMGVDSGSNLAILIYIPNEGTRVLLTTDLITQGTTVPDTPGTTLSQLLDQNKDDRHYWQLALPFNAGLSPMKSISAWAENPLIQALMPLDAEMGVDSGNNPAILICIPNESTRVLLTQGSAIPDTQGKTLSQVLDENKNDPHDWYLALSLADGGWGFDKLSNWINNPVISGFMSMSAIMVKDSNHIDIVTSDERCFSLLHWDF